MLAAVGRVRAGDLEQALLVLPFSDALRLLHYLCSWLARGSRVRCLSCTVILPLFLSLGNTQPACTLFMVEGPLLCKQ